MSDRTNLERTVAAAAASPDGVTAETLADAALLDRETLTVCGVELKLVDSGRSLIRGTYRTWLGRTRESGFAVEVQAGYSAQLDAGRSGRPWSLHVAVGERASVCVIGASLAPLEARAHARLVELGENVAAFVAEVL